MKIPNSSKMLLYDNDLDKFDETLIYINNKKIYKKINIEYFNYLVKAYGKLNVSSILCKMFTNA